MKKVLAIVLALAMVFAFASCSTVLYGKWRVNKVVAGDVKMNAEDIKEMGLEAGYIKLNKSGSCVVNLLGDEYDGRWEKKDEKHLYITYNSDQKGEATLVGDNGMTFIDAQGAEYTLKK